mmetsp:Transcript_2449/g.3839  ORF Transcript_2449/g.3839 Transcript_2449/m.3839 type:complete len:108 (-) Transcript_2449:517-840(-)
MVMAIKVKKLVNIVTSSRDAPDLKIRSCAFGRIESAKTLVVTKTRPMGLNEGVSCQSAVVNMTSPMQTEKAHKYSADEKTFLFISVATIIVGTSLHERKTTFVGKFM